MQTITIAIDNSTALKTLKELEEKHFIRIVDQEHIDSPAIPGKRLSLTEFREWVRNSELSTTVSFEEAKSIWAGKRKQLQNHAFPVTHRYECK